jgi:hypothetical protein
LGKFSQNDHGIPIKMNDLQSRSKVLPLKRRHLYPNLLKAVLGKTSAVLRLEIERIIDFF